MPYEITNQYRFSIFDLTYLLILLHSASFFEYQERKRTIIYLCHNKYYVPRQEVAPDLNNQPREKDKQRSR